MSFAFDLSTLPVTALYWVAKVNAATDGILDYVLLVIICVAAISLLVGIFEGPTSIGRNM
jgi:hypothetical protein